MLQNTDKLIFLVNHHYCSKSKDARFFDTFMGHVEISVRPEILKADFSVVKIGRRIFLKNPVILGLKPAFSKNICEEGAEVQTPTPSFFKRLPGKRNRGTLSREDCADLAAPDVWEQYTAQCL